MTMTHCVSFFIFCQGVSQGHLADSERCRVPADRLSKSAISGCRALSGSMMVTQLFPSLCGPAESSAQTARHIVIGITDAQTCLTLTGRLRALRKLASG